MPLFHGSKDSLPHISDIFLIYTPHSPAKSISFFPQTALPSPAPVHNPMHEISHLPLSIPYHQPSTFPSFLHPLHLSHEKSPAGTKPTGLPMLKANICLFALICGGDGSHLTFWAKIKFAFITNDGLSNIYHTTLLPQQHQVVQKGYKV